MRSSPPGAAVISTRAAPLAALCSRRAAPLAALCSRRMASLAALCSRRMASLAALITCGSALLAALSARRPVARAASLLFALLALLAPLRAWAEPELTTRASSTEVEVGEPFTIEVKALIERGRGSMPSDPELHVPAELTVVSGPSISTQMQTYFRGGVASTQLGIGATWQIVANKPGRYTIPAPTIAWEGKRLRAQPIQIRVSPASGRPRRPSSPFLMPGGPLQGIPWPFGGPGSLLDDEPEEELEDAAPELAMPKEPDPIVFLRAIPDKTAAVIGEQVSVSFYLYFRENAEMGEPRAAPAADFLRHQLIEDARNERPSYTRVGGYRYAVRLVDKLALFPLKAGELHTGKMQARITGRRIGTRVLRESNDIIVRVTEPPRAGRPAGYTLGDVGKFTLTASVQPRQTEQGGSVAVTVRVAGIGNFPRSLRVPERTGLEWLDPEKRESIEPRGGAIGGFRSFGYVVRVQESGTVDLGKIELPYWDPEQKRYVVETAELGSIQVSPVTPPMPSAAPAGPDRGDVDPGAAARTEPFAAMPGLRPALGPYSPPAAPLLEGAAFWCLLAAPPLLVSLVGAGDRLLRRARARRAEGATSPARLAGLAQREAEEAAARGDLKAAAAAIERAVHRAIEAATGLRSRGVLLATLAGELEQRGVSAALSARVSDTLAACEAIRFEPASQAGDAAAATELVARAREVLAQLAQERPA